eukprot:TRINITY_DN6861_c1_g1_i3.p1 TRINITY_DN6861_c1_g1~~TRINITY_DN6861_c1_g1_i3.p1  ORF type:complete len:482 (+),score=99.21 TRINITY_DN6861_c1_g1_i3:147-1592(+)
MEFAKRMCDSLVGVGVGVVLFGVSLFILGWNEKRAVWTAQTIGYARDEYVQLNSCIPDSSYNNKLVAIEGCGAAPSNGDVTTADYLVNIGYSQPSGDLAVMPAVVFSWTRSSQQYVYHETESNKEYSYDPRWESSSETYKNPDMRFSPPSWPSYFNKLSRVSPKICIGSQDVNCDVTNGTSSFVLDTTSSWGGTEGARIGASENLVLNSTFSAKLNSATFNSVSICSGYMQTNVLNGQRCTPTAASGGNFQTDGDFRVQWNRRVKRAGDVVSALALQVQEPDGTIGFSQWQNPHHSSCSYCRIGRFQNGNATGDDILDDLESENKTLTWVLRFVGWIVCWVSLALIFGPISVVPTLVPCIGDFLSELVKEIICAITCVIATSVSVLVIAIAWLAFRPAIGIPLLCVCIAGFVGAVLVINRNKLRREGSGSASGPVYDSFEQYPKQYPPPGAYNDYPPVNQYAQANPYPPQYASAPEGETAM